MFITNTKPKTIVAFVKKFAGPFAPNNESLLPLYAPRPILELFEIKWLLLKNC